jgi:hypothetical protein
MPLSREMLEAAIGAYLREIEPRLDQSERVIAQVEIIMKKVDEAAVALHSLRESDLQVEEVEAEARDDYYE